MSVNKWKGVDKLLGGGGNGLGWYSCSRILGRGSDDGRWCQTLEDKTVGKTKDLLPKIQLT